MTNSEARKRIEERQAKTKKANDENPYCEYFLSMKENCALTATTNVTGEQWIKNRERIINAVNECFKLEEEN